MYVAGNCNIEYTSTVLCLLLGMVPTFQCHLQGKGSTFTSQYFETLSVGQALGSELVNYHSAVKYSTDWASPGSVWHTVTLKFLQNGLKRHMAFTISKILGNSTHGPWGKDSINELQGKRNTEVHKEWCDVLSWFLIIEIIRGIFNGQ